MDTLKSCLVCGCVIPPARIEALPNTTRCIKCSNEKPFKGYMVFAHKTAPEIVCIPTEDVEAIRMADRANSRSR
jgi:hypothetical protein